MHVNNNKLSDHYDINLGQNSRETQTNHVHNGRKASLIDGSSNNSKLIMSAISTGTQSSKISFASSNSPNFSVKTINSNEVNSKISSQFKTISSDSFLLKQLQDLNNSGLGGNDARIFFNNHLVVADSPELIDTDPDDIGPAYLVLKQENGKLALAVDAHLANDLHNRGYTYMDANGQTQTYDVVIIDQHLSSQVQNLLDKFHQTHIAPLLKQKENDSTEERTPFISTCLKSVTKATTQEKIDRRDNEPVDPKVQELAEKVDLFFPTIHSIIIKNVEAEKAKEKEEIELERKNLDKKFTIIQQDVKLFDLFQERVKTGQKFEAISLSEQNHLRANRFKPIEHAKITV